MRKLVKNLSLLWNKFKSSNDDFWQDLEEELIMSDVSVHTAQKILERVRQSVYAENINELEPVKELLRQEIQSILSNSDGLSFSEKKPTVFLVAGVNGVGKTSSIAKLANMFKMQGRSVLVAAADTYRSAAVEQIKHFADIYDFEIVSHQRFSDPGAVVYDSIEKALSKEIDILIIDTAGRMQTSTNLVEELKKIKRVIAKKLNRESDETLLVLDATTGQNAKAQAQIFNEALGLSGIILTKTDSTSKGGVVLTIKSELEIPIKIVTCGETIEDIYFFDPKKFAHNMIE
jgi:fused signal recognition particle receptor